MSEASPPPAGQKPAIPQPQSTPATPAPGAPPPSPPSQRVESPDTTRTKALADKIVAKFPSAKVSYLKERRLKVVVAPGEIKAIAFFIRDGLGFDHIEVMGGTDYVATNEFEVFYFIGCVSNPGQENLVIQLTERIQRGTDARAPSLVDVWTGVEYHERETFDMLGIVFEGHPDLRRILLPEDWDDIPPLRKDYTNPGH